MLDQNLFYAFSFLAIVGLILLEKDDANTSILSIFSSNSAYFYLLF